MVTHRRYLSSDDVASSKPLSVSAHLHSAKYNLRLYLYWVIGLFLDMSHILCHPLCFTPSRTALLPLFHVSLKLCAPLVHSLSDSSPDVSLFISLTDPHAFVLRWFIHSHDPLWFRFAHKSFSHSLSPLFSYLFFIRQMFPSLGEQ